MIQKFLLFNGFNGDDEYFHKNNDPIDIVMPAIEEAVNKHDPHIVVVKEYVSDADELIEEMDSIMTFAYNTKTNILFAPKSHPENFTWHERVSWSDLSQRLQDAGAIVEPVPENRFEYRADSIGNSIGIWFNSSGSAYAFRKMGSAYVHKIPETDIGVSICSELWHIRNPDLEGVSLLLYPARESYDISLTDRNISHYLSEPDSRFDKGSIYDTSAFKGKVDTPVISCNSPESSGLVYPDRAIISNLDVTDRYMLLEADYNSTSYSKQNQTPLKTD
jgi:hypothetical protein